MHSIRREAHRASQSSENPFAKVRSQEPSESSQDYPDEYPLWAAFQCNQLASSIYRAYGYLPSYVPSQYQYKILFLLEKELDDLDRMNMQNGGDFADVCRWRADISLVTKQLLRELDIPNIITNIKLRHDVNFDQDLSFRPNLDGLKGQEKMRQSVERIASLLKEHCAPMRDALVDEMVQSMMVGVTQNKPDWFIGGCRKLVEILKVMKLDIANHQIRNLKTLLIEDTANFERHYRLGRLVGTTTSGWTLVHIAALSGRNGLEKACQSSLDVNERQMGGLVSLGRAVSPRTHHARRSQRKGHEVAPHGSDLGPEGVSEDLIRDHRIFPSGICGPGSLSVLRLTNFLTESLSNVAVGIETLAETAYAYTAVVYSSVQQTPAHFIATGSVFASRLSYAGRKSDSFSQSIGPLPILSFLIPGVVGQNADAVNEDNWRQRATETLYEIIVTFSFLLAPTLILLAFGLLASLLLWYRKAGASFLIMLFVAAVFVTARKHTGTDPTDTELFAQFAVGVSYTFFMLVYCRLVMIRDEQDHERRKRGKGFGAVAIGLGVLLTIIEMVFAPIAEYWTALTTLDPIFSLSITVPLSFALCDLAEYIADCVNGTGRQPLLPLAQQSQRYREPVEPADPNSITSHDIEMINLQAGHGNYHRRARRQEESGSDDMPAGPADEETTNLQSSNPPLNRVTAWFKHILSKTKKN